MCVIIDASLAASAFAAPCSPDFTPLWDWVLRKDGCVVYGGKLARELDRIREGALRLRQLSAAGKAHRMPDVAVSSEEKVVLSLGVCRSNDPHVIALARVSRARVLCSADRNLHADFTNPRLLSKPKGRVYQNANHARILSHTPGCPGRPRR
jgi:hypothetical protein